MRLTARRVPNDKLQLYTCTEPDRWREDLVFSRPAGSYRWVSWQAWQSVTVRVRVRYYVDGA
jgi:hypothetical protein